jgi:uncharacterized protein (TIGR02246 family)
VAWPTSDELAIREVVDTWMTASKAGDLATALDHMTDDVVFMVPGREPFGKDEFRTMSEGMKSVAMDGRAQIRELRVIGDWAWLSNDIDPTMSPPGRGERVRRAGYAMTILHKGDDGRWRLTHDVNLVT